jgi:hypothetical protein
MRFAGIDSGGERRAVAVVNEDGAVLVLTIIEKLTEALVSTTDSVNALVSRDWQRKSDPRRKR